MNNFIFEGELLFSNKKVRGSLYSNKPFYDIVNDQRYYLIFDEDWDLEAQINYCKQPSEFEHLSESVHQVKINSIKYLGDQKIITELVEVCKELLSDVRKQGELSMFGASVELVNKAKQTIKRGEKCT